MQNMKETIKYPKELEQEKKEIEYIIKKETGENIKL